MSVDESNGDQSVPAVKLPIDLEAVDTLNNPDFGWDDISLTYLRPMGFTSNSMEVRDVIDVRKVGLTTARWLVSRKRLPNLGDVVGKMRREVLSSVTHALPLQNSEEDSPSIADDLVLFDDTFFGEEPSLG